MSWPAVAGSVLLVFVLTSADVFLDRRGWLPAPSSVVSFGIVLLLVAGTLLTDRRSAAERRAAGAGMAWLLAPLLVLGGLTLLGIWREGAHGGENSKHFLLIVYNIGAFAAALLLGTAGWLQRRWRAVARVAVLAGVASIAWDLVAPGSFSTEVARAAGFGANANAAALQIVVPLAIALRYDRLRVGDLALVAVAVLGVFATLSRGGGVMLGCVLAAWIAATFFGPALRGEPGALRVVVATLLATPLVVGALAAVVATSPMFEEVTARRRIDILLGRSSFVQPRESRVELAREYVDLISVEPVLGHGPGFVHARLRGPHNMFLRTWVELGLAGIVAFCAWLVVLLHHGVRRNSVPGVLLVVILVLVSLVSDNLLEQRLVMLFVGIEMGRLLVGDRKRTVP